MKIYEGNLTGSAGQTGRAPETQSSARETAGRAGGSAGNSATDRVELSSGLNSLSRALSSFGSSRAQKVERLAAQYQSGQYKVDAMGTSRGIVAEALSKGAG